MNVAGAIVAKIRDLNPIDNRERLIYAQLEVLPSAVLTKVILWAAHQLEQRTTSGPST